MSDPKTREQILEQHFGSEYPRLKELGYLENILNAMEEWGITQRMEGVDSVIKAVQQ